MKVVEIIFSPTGGTEKVAHIIGGQWSEMYHSLCIWKQGLRGYSYRDGGCCKGNRIPGYCSGCRCC